MIAIHIAATDLKHIDQPRGRISEANRVLQADSTFLFRRYAGLDQEVLSAQLFYSAAKHQRETKTVFRTAAELICPVVCQRREHTTGQNHTV